MTTPRVSTSTARLTALTGLSTTGVDLAMLLALGALLLLAGSLACGIGVRRRAAIDA